MKQSGSDVTFTGGTAEIPSKAIIAICIDDIAIQTASFISKERGNREGFLQITINGQTTLLPFQGKGTKAKPLHLEIGNKILFFGPCPSVFEIDARVIETNEAIRNFLGKVESVTDLIQKLPTTALSPATAPAAGLIGGITRLLRKQSADSHEAIYLTSWDAPVADGQSISLSLANQKGIVAQLSGSIRELGPPKGKARTLRVAVEAPRIEWSTQKLTVSKSNKNISVKTRRKERVSAEEYFSRLAFSTLSFEAKSGRKRRNLTLPASAMTTGLSWQRLHCFQVSHTRSSKNRLAIPLEINFILREDDLPIDEIDEVIDHAAKLGSALGSPLPPEINAIRRKLPSVLSQLSDLTPHALSLCNFDGVVVLQPTGTDPLPAGKGYLSAMETDNGWRTTVTHPILLGSGEPIGTFLFDLVVTRAST